ncbi:unnamed protein product [Leptosia nina]|uniref:LITAF domain-containing protein n=1 Tax=Leptosia nina TaxID=320188 RepID=A0AAV1JQQ0_9NEOP
MINLGMCMDCGAHSTFQLGNCLLRGGYGTNRGPLCASTLHHGKFCSNSPRSKWSEKQITQMDSQNRPKTRHHIQPQGIPLQEPLVPGAVPGATIIITQSMGTQPAVTVCRSCGIQITTRVEQMPSMRTHLFALLLCLIGFWPCACVPYCIDTCNNADHYCPNCNAFIGSYHGV